MFLENIENVFKKVSKTKGFYINSINFVSFHQKLEFIQYNVALAIIVAIRGTSRKKLYHDLGFESIVSRRWYRKLLFLQSFQDSVT